MGTSFRDRVLEIIQTNPGLSGFRISEELDAQWHRDSWLGRRVEPAGLIACLFNFSIGKMYVALAELETAGEIYGAWGAPRASGHRPRHYYPRGK